MSFNINFSRESAFALSEDKTIKFEHACVWPAVDDLFRTEFRSVQTRPGKTCVRGDYDRTPEGFFSIHLVAECEPISERPKRWFLQEGYDPWSVSIELKKRNGNSDEKELAFENHKIRVYKIAESLEDEKEAEEIRSLIGFFEEQGLDNLELWDCIGYEFNGTTAPFALDASEFAIDDGEILQTITKSPPRHLAREEDEDLLLETRYLVKEDLRNIAHALGNLSLPKELVELAYTFAK